MRKMGKGFWRVLLAVCCLLLTGCGENAESSQTDEGDGIITMTLFTENKSQYTGLQEDPVARYIRDRFGIRIVLSSYVGQEDAASYAGNYSEMLNIKLQSNDLDDIMDFGSVREDPQVLDNLNKAVEGDLLLPLDDLVASYAPNIQGDERLRARNEYRQTQMYTDGHYYSLGSSGGMCEESLPEAANWVRWDIYSQLGYPDAPTDEEFLTLLGRMQEACPETPAGDQTYGLGGGLADGDAALIKDYARTKGYEAIRDNYAAFFNQDTQTVENLILDEDSVFWKGVAFYFHASQMQLLDPESAQMSAATYTAKINKGIYLAALNGSQVMGKESILAGKGMGNAGYMPVRLLEDVKAFPAYEEYNLGEHEIAISKDCKHPEKAMEFLDWCFSEEGSRILTQGTKGLAWNVMDEKTSLTKTYKKDVDLGITDIAEVYGTGKYESLAGYRDQVKTAAGEYIKPELDPEEAAYSAVEKDALAFYGTVDLVDYFTDYTNRQGEKVPNIFWNSYKYGIGNEPVYVKSINVEVNQYIQAGILRCIYAADETEYEQIKQEIMQTTEQLGIGQVADWYTEEIADHISQ